MCQGLPGDVGIQRRDEVRLQLGDDRQVGMAQEGHPVDPTRVLLVDRHSANERRESNEERDGHEERGDKERLTAKPGCLSE